MGLGNYTRMRILIASLVLLSLGCTTEAPRVPASPTPSQPALAVAVPQTAPSNQVQLPVDTVFDPTESGAALKRLDRLETAALPMAEGRVSRVKGELHVQLTGGRTIIYPPDEHFDTWHRYAGYLKPIRSHIIHVVGMEGSGIFLVVDDSTGDTTATLSNPPILSPDGTRFVVTAMTARTGPDADYDPIELEVWRLVARKAEREFLVQPKDYEPSNAVWRDSVTIDFIKTIFVPPDYTTVSNTPARLQRRDGKWAMVDP